MSGEFSNLRPSLYSHAALMKPANARASTQPLESTVLSTAKAKPSLPFAMENSTSFDITEPGHAGTAGGQHLLALSRHAVGLGALPHSLQLLALLVLVVFVVVRGIFSLLYLVESSLHLFLLFLLENVLFNRSHESFVLGHLLQRVDATKPQVVRADVQDRPNRALPVSESTAKNAAARRLQHRHVDAGIAQHHPRG